VEARPNPLSPVDNAETEFSIRLIRNFSVIRLKQWSFAFENFLRDRHDLNDTEQRAVRILNLHRAFVGIGFSVDMIRTMSDETIWDEHLEEFKQIIRYAKDVLASTAGPQRPTFTLDTEIILPLYFVAVKCRDSRVRREAAALLKSEERQERIWNSLLSASVAERVVQIEEEELDGAMVSAEAVSRWNRVLGVEVRLETENTRAIVKYLKLTAQGRVETMEELIVWDGCGT
jgi:hypothetical protein